MALQAFVGFWLLSPVHGRYHSLDVGSARHKASTYTQDNTNTE
jgi:hypothetical protein